MLTFLRKVRRSLIESGSTRRYLLYAIGEITLVVIGILVALQINNWNEHRKTQRELADHLENLADDLNEDIAEYTDQYRLQHLRFNAFLYVLDLAGFPLEYYEPLHFPDKTWGKDWGSAYPDTFNREFISIAYDWMDHGFVSTQVSRTAVEEIKNLGLFSRIANDQLKKRINGYYKYIDWIFGEAIVFDYQKEAVDLGKYLRDQYGVINIDISDLEDPVGFLERHKDVRLRLRSVINDTYYHALEMLKTKTMAEELIKVIEEELENASGSR